VCLTRSAAEVEPRTITLGHPLLDDYLEFVGARARPNTWLATAYDLKVFFGGVAKEPAQVTTADVFGFIKAQRAPRRGPRVVRLEDGEAGLAARTIKRRLASVSGLFNYLVARGDVGVAANPVPRGTMTRRPTAQAGRWGTPLIRTPRTLPRVLSPVEVDAFLGALRTRRDRAMVEAMLLGGLRRCEVLGLRLRDVNAGQRRLFVAEGKGGHQRIVPVSGRFFATLAGYLDQERPRTSATDRVFVVLKGPRRGLALSAGGLDEIIDGARGRAGLERLTCHQLRHTCLTRLREAGMALEAVQAQAGHRSIESTRIYLHLANAWLAAEYAQAAEAIEADLRASTASADQGDADAPTAPADFSGEVR
jgi:integrase